VKGKRVSFAGRKSEKGDIRVDDSTSDSSSLEKTEFLRRLLRETFSDGLTSGEDEPVLAGTSTNLDEVVLGLEASLSSVRGKRAKKRKRRRTNSESPICSKNSSFHPLLSSAPGGT
jgi:hypothetical protein